MLRSLKAKFTIAFGSLIIVLFVGMGAFLIDAKERELQSDVSSSVQAFAQFTSQPIMGNYFQFLEPGNFIPFTRELNGILRKSNEISAVSIHSFNGVTLYDSSVEEFSVYEGAIRTVSDLEVYDRIQSTKMSLLLDDGRTIYIKVDDEKNIEYVDFNEDPVADLTSRDRVLNVVVPFENAYALEYSVDYTQLESKLMASRNQILMAALMGLLLALILSYMLSVSITNPIKSLKQGAVKISKGDFNARVKVKSKDEVGLLAKTFNQMAVDLEKSTEAMKYQERVEKELELASQIQEKLLPDEKIELDSMDLAGGLVPATEIGGDAFDYLTLEDGRKLIYLGDVTGHGVAAGIVSSITNAMLYVLRNENDLHVLTTKLNEVIFEKTSQKVFVTMALTLWDEKKNTLSYLNAGHPPILYYSASKKKVFDLSLPGIALGMLSDIADKVSVKDVEMSKGDVIVMYSDGIPEAVNAKGQQYGMAHLKRIVQDAANDLYTAEGIKNAVLSDVVEYIGNREHDDDMTVVVMKAKI